LLDLVAAGALYAGLLFLVSALIPADVVQRDESEAPAFFIVQLLDDGILAGVALGFGRLRFPGSWAALGFRRARPGWWGIGAAGGALAAVAAWTISIGLDHWGLPAPTHVVESVLSAAHGPRDLLLIVVAVTVLVPIAEEAFFRGFAYRVLRARFGVVAAVATTAVLFALMHGLEVAAWLPVFPVGLVLAAVVERSGSLWPAMVGHSVVNLLAVLTE
jgi:membrane protease YdiL (CAAX protease family)